jgi:hypothetical protein
MGRATQQQRSDVECPHCGDDSGTCHAMRCLKCEALLCSRCVTPVLATHPYYPYKHRVRGHWCGPVQPMLLPPAAL